MTTANPYSGTPLCPGRRVAIIGGGFTGAAVAYHLAHGMTPPDEITVFEPRGQIGKGLAYDTADPAHRINVPAGRMSLLPDQPDHFFDWIQRHDAAAGDPAALLADGSLFPRRHVFGDYIHANVSDLLREEKIRHVHAAVTEVEKVGHHWQITDSDGGMTEADILVIATSHPSPVAPSRLASALAGQPKFIVDATRPEALAAIGSGDRVLLVGNGLTAADVVASLAIRGHRGAIVALSRRGLRSRGHAPVVQEPYGDFLSPPPKTALELLRLVRATIAAARAEGLTWHAVLDQVRTQGRAIWQSLPVVERRRILRHLRVFWDVHRFRIAPQVESALDEAIAAGRLEIVAASILDAHMDGDRLEVSFRPRRGAIRTEKFDAVVVTTGPAHGAILSSQGWLSRMAQAGWLAMDPTKLGLACNYAAQALDSHGHADPSLLIAGPLARGHFGELMGFPQVSEHAELVARSVNEQLAAITRPAA